MCGEHQWVAIADTSKPGSSPRVRGTLTALVGDLRRDGIIPACAGNTVPAQLVHTVIEGSSPRVRGTPRYPYSRYPTSRDHPRVCGEHTARLPAMTPTAGSSPRVRGTRDLALGHGVAEGIIPACAGNTDSIHCRSRSSRDHPRVCGEHYKHRGSITPNPGSSPRVRGTLRGRHLQGATSGIIPACAGNTYDAEGREEAVGDHPRVCGEHTAHSPSTTCHSGSSPRVRGTPGR